MATRAQLLRDLLFFLRNDLNTNITDPISSTRSSKSDFVMTSYPQRPAIYPLITIKIPSFESRRAGMQSTQMDITLTVEVRCWCRNEREKDTIATDVLDRLANIQFSTGGSVLNDFHEFNVLSATEVDEEGEGAIKSRVITAEYKFYG